MNPIVLSWLWFVAAAAVALAARFMPRLLARLFNAVAVAIAIAAMVLVFADFYWVPTYCVDVPWWVLWCTWDEPQPALQLFVGGR